MGLAFHAGGGLRAVGEGVQEEALRLTLFAAVFDHEVEPPRGYGSTPGEDRWVEGVGDGGRGVIHGGTEWDEEAAAIGSDEGGGEDGSSRGEQAPHGASGLREGLAPGCGR